MILLPSSATLTYSTAMEDEHINEERILSDGCIRSYILQLQKTPWNNYKAIIFYPKAAKKLN
jgi:hypothetical protein